MPRIFAPAKVNLFLHVCGKRGDGYHLLDSLVTFADVGDFIDIEPAQSFSFDITGDFSNSFSGRDLDATPASGNLVVRAVWALSRTLDRSPNVHIRLTKNLPLGAGIGGGSADAAALVWGLLDYWNIACDADFVMPLLQELGADVPVCFRSRTARMRGIGDILDPIEHMADIPAVLVYPAMPSSTQMVFAGLRAPDSAQAEQIFMPQRFESIKSSADFLTRQRNDLLEPATAALPVITNALAAIKDQDGCLLSRMSGSGSTCFGVFKTQDQASSAAQHIAKENPDWWVRDTMFLSVDRY